MLQAIKDQEFYKTQHRVESVGALINPSEFTEHKKHFEHSFITGPSL